MHLSTLYLLLAIIATANCRIPRLRPVFEHSSNDNHAHIGNPMWAHKANPNHMIQSHIQNQQVRFNNERLKRQKAQVVQVEQAKKAMDSYMKAYQDQHEFYQKEQESQQIGLVNRNFHKPNYPSARFPSPSQRITNSREKRVYEPISSTTPEFKELPSETKGQARSFTSAGVTYDNSPFVPMVEYGSQYRFYEPEYSPRGVIAAPIQQVVQYQPRQLVEYNSVSDVHDASYLKSLNSLIGKQPQDQLKGLDDLLRRGKTLYNFPVGQLQNSHINLKASSLDVPAEYQNRYALYSQQAVKDHTPITENVQEDDDDEAPAKVVVIPPQHHHHRPTEIPSAVTSASNYYKVEVGSNVLDGKPAASHSYIHNTVTQTPSYTSGYDNLHNYASNYEFGYRVRDLHSGNDFGHQETSVGDESTGRYHVLLPDGRLQEVVYKAGPDGFKAHVTYH